MTDYIAERIKIDIAERIRRLPELANLPGGALGADCFEAAIEIEALRAENARLLGLLDSALGWLDDKEHDEPLLSVDSIRAARAAMGETE